jgi:tetratricopeptide (TPR) repeat protein
MVMTKRLGWGALIGCLALLSQTGCQTTPHSNHADMTAWKQTPTPHASEQEADKQLLPPDRAAQLSLTTAQMLEKNGHEAEAVLQYEKARQYNPRLTNATARHLAVLYDQQGEFPKAIAEYKRALQQSPKDPDLLNDVGYCYFQMAEWAEAEKWFRHAVEMNPSHKRAWTNLGMTLGQQQRYAESLEAFKRAVGPAEAQCNLAFVYSTQGKHAEAHQAYMTALNIQPDLQLARAALTKLMGGDPKTSATDADRGEQVAAMARLSGFVREQMNSVQDTPTTNDSDNGNIAVVATETASISELSTSNAPSTVKRRPPSTRPISLSRSNSRTAPPSDGQSTARPIAVAAPGNSKVAQTPEEAE